VLTGKNNDEKIWNYLKAKGFSDYGAAGVMANTQAESGNNPQNLQNIYEKKLGFTDATYTAAVDNGSYGNFVRDSAGYGLCQWTFWSRKQNLLTFAQAQKKSIGDLEMQLDFLLKELSEGYGSLLEKLRSAGSVKEASDAFMLQFERPADQSEAAKNRRTSCGQQFYDKFAAKTKKEEGKMSNSPLVSYTKISPNRNSPRNHAIDRITVHCVVGQCSVETIGNVFAPTSRQASSNYGIGPDGRIGMYCEEKDRSWCSSSSDNDHRAVTIEVASDTAHPYAVKDAAYRALLDLLTDICKRNGKKKLLWFGDKTKTLAYAPKSDEMVMTVHRWFANKSCPGQYLYDLHPEMAAEVTKRLGGGTASAPTTSTAQTSSGSAAFKDYLVRVSVTDLNIRKGPGTNNAVAGVIKPGVYTIVAESTGHGATKWGKLKSGAGWISLDFCKKV